MNTLILNGSPRKNGDTAYLLDLITKNIRGSHTLVNSYEITQPCTDCRFCTSSLSCTIKDSLTPIIDNIDDFTRVIIASPLYYNQPTGSLLSLLSRFQLIFAREHFTLVQKPKPKLGGIVLVGGGDTVINSADAEKTLRIALKSINCTVKAYCRSLNTSKIPARDDKAVHKEILEMLRILDI